MEKERDVEKKTEEAKQAVSMRFGNWTIITSACLRNRNIYEGRLDQLSLFDLFSRLVLKQASNSFFKRRDFTFLFAYKKQLMDPKLTKTTNVLLSKVYCFETIHETNKQ